jgi:hypothetical protein
MYSNLPKINLLISKLISKKKETSNRCPAPLHSCNIARMNGSNLRTLLTGRGCQFRELVNAKPHVEPLTLHHVTSWTVVSDLVSDFAPLSIFHKARMMGIQRMLSHHNFCP